MKLESVSPTVTPGLALRGVPQLLIVYHNFPKSTHCVSDALPVGRHTRRHADIVAQVIQRDGNLALGPIVPKIQRLAGVAAYLGAARDDEKVAAFGVVNPL